MPDKLKKMNPGTLKKLLPFLKKRWPLLALSLLLAAGTVVIQLYVPVLFGNAIDEILGEGQVRFEALSGWLLKILLFVGLSAFGTYLMNLINNRMTYGIVEGLRSKAIRHLQTLPLSYLDTHSAGDIVSRVITDIDTLSDGLLLGFTQLFSGVVTIGVTLVFMFSKNLWISLFVVLMTPLSFLVARFISSQSYKLFRKQSELRGKQTSFIDEIVSNQKVVKAFGYENRSSKRFSEINEELTECSQQAVFFSSLTNPSTRFVNNLVYAGVALFGVLLIPGGSLTVGGLSVLLSYANQYMKPFNDISSVITELQNALACASRIFDFLEVSAESRDAEGHLEKVAGQIQLSDVSFRYTKDRPLIEHFDLQVQPGMRIAIVGPTGCGKTTLINLLMRFYEVTNGRITVDGQDIRKLSRHSLRSAYGMVLQDTWIKNGTVRDNIRFGKPDASEEEILKAAKGAHCSEFIKRLPKGLDTVLNENDLSQGQKQLLCIARVMLCLPPMLILDEATSSIDTRTELEIQQAFDTLMEGRTSFVVAHRLSTIRNASLVLVMKEGKIIEKGTHEELLAAGGFYHRLYNSQFQKA
ncbi:MAG: ABC transporter ATP-binding protein [Clostridiales bacterium]|nr:ABC transporter ATP-binding protein [Clostridiales bacterium]